MNRLIYLPVLLTAVLLASCSKPENFRISGKFTDGASHIVEITYEDEGALKKLSAQSDEKGEWTLEGSTTGQTLATLRVSGSSPLAMLILENGDELSVEIGSGLDASDVKVKGNKSSELLAQFEAQTAKDLKDGKSEDMNLRVARFVKEHPDETASAALLVMRFDSRGNEEWADSLMSLISPKAKPQGVMQNYGASIANQISTESREDIQPMALYDRRDTTIRFSPSRQSYALFAFVDTNKKMRDSIVPRLRSLREDWPEKRLAAIEVSLAQDSARWKQSVVRDSAEWVQAWAPGTVASANFRRLSVRRIPFFIVADSTGHQLYRGGSITEAEELLKKQLNKK